MNVEFNKKILFDNIYLLIKQSDLKIGELETRAGVSPGYISRTSKEGTAKPGIEFIMKVADILEVSIDLLLNTNMTQLTSTENYLLSFIEKLRKDTADDKLEWHKETAKQLKILEPDDFGEPGHPLFSWAPYKGRPSRPPESVFNSDSYGSDTVINGDCFNICLKNEAVLYIMNISNGNDSGSDVKELWMHNKAEIRFLCSSKDVSGLASGIDELYDTIKINIKHPKVDSGIRYIIDSFMKDDFTNDIDDEVPF